VTDEELVAWVARQSPEEQERTFRNARELSLKGARADYASWCEEVGRDRGWKPAKHHRVIVQAVEETISGRGPPRLLINAPPGSAKSTYTSELLPAHLLSRQPAFNLIGASNTSTLAEDFSERTLALVDQRPDLVPFKLRKRSAPLWTTDKRGRYRAAGVGVAIAGNRADGVLIDDPVKSREAAESETMREKLWNWFLVDLRTRLKPGAWIIVIMCMTGDTPVRMADGAEKPLRDVRPGDMVLSYDRERRDFVCNRVLNWCSQGIDHVYEIKTIYGSSVRANERHPFLVEREGVLEWVKVRELVVGDRIVRAQSKGAPREPSAKGAPATSTTQSAFGRTLWGTMASIAAKFARLKIVTPPRSAEVCATSIMDVSDGPAGIAPRHAIRRPSARGTSNIAMGYPRANTRLFTSVKMGFVRFVVRGRMICVGMAERGAYAWITIMRAAKFAASFAMPAMSRSGSRTPLKSWNEPQPTFDIITSIEPAGREEVFDIEVENVHNFIADGLCVSNTRWHQDDLGGRLIERQPGQWRVLNIPAQATGDEPDPLGRQPGEWLWGDDEYGYAKALQLIKAEYEAAGAMRDWNALYQGKPTAGEGTVFKVHSLEVLETEPGKTPHIVRAWDLAATKKMGTANPDWTVGVKMMRTREDRYVVLDVVRFRGGPEDVEAGIINTAKQDGRHCTVGLPQDPGQAGKSQVATFTKKLAGYKVVSTPETGDKATRAAPAAAQVNIGNVGMVRATWNHPFREELAAFPSGTFDDQVDAFSRAFSMVALNRPLVVSNEALKDLRYGLRQLQTRR